MCSFCLTVSQLATFLCHAVYIVFRAFCIVMYIFSHYTYTDIFIPSGIVVVGNVSVWISILQIGRKYQLIESCEWLCIQPHPPIIDPRQLPPHNERAKCGKLKFIAPAKWISACRYIMQYSIRTVHVMMRGERGEFLVSRPVAIGTVDCGWPYFQIEHFPSNSLHLAIVYWDIIAITTFIYRRINWVSN